MVVKTLGVEAWLARLLEKLARDKDKKCSLSVKMTKLRLNKLFVDSIQWMLGA